MYAQPDPKTLPVVPFLTGNLQRRIPLFAALKLVVAACLLVFQAACASSAGPVSALPALQSTAYQLGTGDEVRVSVYGFDPLSGAYLVTDQGSISLPLTGSVAVAGKTLAEAEAAVASALVERQVAVKPSVSLQVIKYRPFFVLGEVQKPGSYAFQPGMSVLQAISVAGGYTFRADRKAYGISRNVDGRVVKGKVDETAPLQPGDTLIVYEAWF